MHACRLLLLPALAVLVLFGSAAAGQSGPSRKVDAYTSCMNSGDAKRGVTSGIMDCQRQELGRRDTALNAAYARLRKRLSPARFNALQQSERQWIRRRDKKCWHSASDEEFGTLAQIEAMNCLLSETLDRTEWLLRYR